ncbi:hypothetical protein PTTG_01954 [Puccinia triticina 1-1 BBBD Race 1]|uniref:Uncharacterized protein n=1 Tax=Puccinia triticina (isolate 1-1 / race 1 (BBBD)) TaxID=630390 RepID=A0A0C4EMG4_PUCT1|nr:hypothetical protein PTTG_01954 [Puccinia triticina 1-1 BBBD Race 1]
MSPNAAGPAPELKDIEINGGLVNSALGLTPATPHAPIITLPQFPPIRFSYLDYSTLPLPAPPGRRRRLRSPDRRKIVLILLPDLPQELRDIRLDEAMTRDDDDDST